MNTYIGTSGWLYKDWAGRFYPEDMKEADKLQFYTKHFNTVEINSTFYHMPMAKSVARWHEITPDNFTFTLKMNRYATHTKHLVIDAQTTETLDTFFERACLLKQKLGMVLVQLPPSMRVEPERLQYLVERARAAEQRFDVSLPLAIEFRHASWFTDEIFGLMREYNLTNVVNDSPNRWPASKEITSDTVYVRFHGNKRLYRSSYTDEELRVWAEFIRTAKVQRAFAYFNNDYDATAVRNAQSLKEILTR